MPLGLNDFLFGCVIPAATTIGMWLLVSTISSQIFASKSTEARDEHAAGGLRSLDSAVITLAFLAGMLLGYGLLNAAPWTPKSHWHYWPYAVVLAGAVGVSAEIVVGRLLFARAVIYALATIAIAWFLVPTWEDLSPSRTTYLVLTVVILVAVTFGVERTLGDASGGGKTGADKPACCSYAQLFLAAFQFTVVCLVFLSGSLRFTQLAMLPASCVIALQILPQSRNRLRNLAFPMAVAFAGMLLVAQVNSFSRVPKLAYILVALSPCLAAIGRRSSSTTKGQMEDQRGWFGKAAFSEFWSPCIALLLALLWAVLVEFVLVEEQEY